MSIVNEHLKATVAGRPARHVDKNGGRYLSRYFMEKFADGRQLWLHRFYTDDGDEMLHNHAWWARSWVVTGHYVEQYVAADGVRVRRRTAPVGPVVQMSLPQQLQRALRGSRWLSLEDVPGTDDSVTPCIWHRILQVEPDTWTALVVDPLRRPNWYFAKPNGYGGEPVAVHDEIALPDGWEFQAIPSAGEDWYKSCCPCGAGCQLCSD